MTERVYYASDATEGRALIIGCRAEADGRYAIELDRTLFHPQGGGQPSDSGWIDEQVVMTVATRGDSVLHIVEQPLPLGEVKIRMACARWDLASYRLIPAAVPMLPVWRRWGILLSAS